MDRSDFDGYRAGAAKESGLEGNWPGSRHKGFRHVERWECGSESQMVKKEQARIARAAQALSRKRKGSKNRTKAREQLRRTYQRAVNQRRNFCHHVSKALVSTFDLIAYEDLNIANMAKGSFAKSILDAAWGELIWQLSYKAESAGRWAIPVNPKDTTQRCSGCGATVTKKLSDRVHSCPTCGLELSRDHNAALNVLALGMSAAGNPKHAPTPCVSSIPGVMHDTQLRAFTQITKGDL
jgi:IS605 OrfB family transposase